MARRPGKRGDFAEAQSAFVGAALALDSIHAAYGYRCAFTGADLRAEATADPVLPLLRLVPSGDVSPTTAIPACADAIYAYERGHLALGSRLEFLVALDRIAPELLGILNPIGRLSPPSDPAFLPNAALLKAHREEFAEGFID